LGIDISVVQHHPYKTTQDLDGFLGQLNVGYNDFNGERSCVPEMRLALIHIQSVFNHLTNSARRSLETFGMEDESSLIVKPE
jgi:hypothetical protein